MTTAAVAAPIAYYNPASGNIRFGNDTAAALFAIFVQSASSDKVINDLNRFAQIPGATFDPSNLPESFTYLNFPQTGPVNSFSTSIDIGNVIVPGTPISDLTLGAISGGIGNPVFGTMVVEVPEPVTLPMVGLALIGVAAAVRRRASAFTGTTRRRRSLRLD